MGRDPHVRACPWSRAQPAAQGPPECIYQIPCVHRACSLGRGVRASFKSFGNPKPPQEDQEELGWQMAAHYSLNTRCVLGAGGRETSKMLPLFL